MNVELLEQARTKIPSIPTLVNLVSKRTRELINGKRPLVKPEPDEDKMDTVLREIATGKLIAEVDYSSLAEENEEDED
jgi:DNA-directed RNA polymerase omega subunit